MFFSGFIQGLVITLIVLSLLFAILYPRSPRSLTIDGAKAKYCAVLVRNPKGCSGEIDTNSIQITDFDANRDGKIDEKDTLQALCENWYAIEKGNQIACKESCGC